jgi:alkylation response protein AidB-like acyl-CoA dehydrogenase
VPDLLHELNTNTETEPQKAASRITSEYYDLRKRALIPQGAGRMDNGEYRPPLREMRFVLEALDGLERLRALGTADVPDNETCAAIFEEAARFAELELAPTYRLADERGVRFAAGRVTLAPEIVAAYARFIEAGWAGVTAPAEYGGAGLPQLIGTPIAEMWRSANLAFALCPMLAQSAVEALLAHGSEEIKARFLPKLVSGEWTASMNLTEPQAGSDLAAIETRAERRGDHYLLRGRKIFITWGDHDLSENIAHLVLARTGPREAGHRGLSMFLAPKYLVRDDGSLGERNDIATVSVEHKLGIRGSPTCVLSYGDAGGAVAYLVGEEGQGLACMFTMMNRARLAVGVEGLGMAERAYQTARAYALERVQGKPPRADRAQGGSLMGRAAPRPGAARTDAAAVPDEARATIAGHPDVRRMLLFMKAATEGMRWTAYGAAVELDIAARHSDAGVAARAAARVALLTPIVKGWCTELAQEVVSMGLQVHGGAGYIEEAGAAQLLRDARITTIYEGTTGIQALDLVKRKIIADEGRAVLALLDEISAWCESQKVEAALRPPIVQALAEAVRLAETAIRFVIERHAGDAALAGAVSVNLLMLLGTLLGGFGHGRAARAAAQRLLDSDEEQAFLEAKAPTAAFYAEHLLPRTKAYCASILAGSGSVMALSDAQL